MTKVLLVEDDNILAEMYETILVRAGYEFKRAADGAKGLEIITSYMPDLVLLDIVMPNVNGIEFLERVKRDEKLKHIPVIIITNVFSSEDNIKSLLQMGAADYLVKSELTPGQVVEKVRSILSPSNQKSKESN